MKNTLYLIVAALLLLTVSACKKKSCADVVCAVYQICGAGQCYCNNGYEGDTCGVLSATKYLGGWTVNENCPDGPSGLATYYSVSITQDINTGTDVIGISPFLGMGTFYAQIVNNGPTNQGTNLYIPPQNSSNGAVQITASTGTYIAPSTPGGKPEILITLNYTYAGNTNQCIETLRKN
jgi:hypothetical protein